MNTNMEKPRLLDRLRPNLIWIIFVTLGWYMFIAGIGHLAWESLMESIKGSVSPEMFFTLDLYAATIVDILTLYPQRVHLGSLILRRFFEESELNKVLWLFEVSLSAGILYREYRVASVNADVGLV